MRIARGDSAALLQPGRGAGVLVLDPMVEGFLCESYAVREAKDITGFGGWRRYRSA
jgi:allophanate hydrolase